jgi:hypothetical protein
VLGSFILFAFIEIVKNDSDEQVEEEKRAQ